MNGPWDKYKAASSVPDGPWTKYATPDEAPAAVQAGAGLMEIPRQLGLTARYGMEGLAQAAQIVTEPIRQMVVNPIARAAGIQEARPLAEGASRLADSIGLPKPQGANERVIGDATRLVAGAGGIAGTSQALARGTTGATQAVLQGLGANPAQQALSAAGAGGAGGAVREAGGGEGAQLAAALIGGVVAPVAGGAAQRVGSRTAAALTPKQTAQQVEQRIELTLQRQGIDWSQVPERVRQGVRAEVEKAMRTGEDLDPAAVGRLLDFKRVEGSTPTRGMLTLDPVQITRERNLAKSAANSGNTGLQGLARVENENNRALIDSINSIGASGADDAVGTGQRVVGALQRGLDREKAGVDALYSTARDSQGRSFPLDGASFSSRANKALDDSLLGGALPPSVAEQMNRIARGEVPFTVDYAEQLKTAIGKLQRGTSDGQQRMALSIVRQALDDAPVMGLGQQGAAPGARALNPGNLPALPGTPNLGEDAIGAFNAARGANRSMMQRIESTPALQAVYDGVEPDQFVQRFIVGQGASVRDVQALRSQLDGDPQALQAVRSYLAGHLKSKALGGAADEVGNFSASNFNKALDAIGDRKLAAFFEPQELEQLRAIGRVGSYMTVQPKGSAVNNSNSGALLLGRGLDFLDSLGGAFPLAGIGPQIQGVIRGPQQSAATRVAPALTRPDQRVPLTQLAGPATVYGGLFALPGVPPRQDEQRP